eukprot:476674_1
MSTTDCSTTSLLPRIVTITYGTVYGLFAILVSIYSFNFLMKYHKTFMNASLMKKFKIWIMDTWRRKGCYIPIIAHIFDQITDVSVAIQFYLLARDKSDDGEWTDCNGLNIYYLFILTVLSMTIYRLFSSYLIYKETKSWIRFISQMLDMELLRTLYINYLCNKLSPCDPQRWITTIEATLESSPQALIQLIYLVKTDTFTSSPLVLISFLSSLLCIVSKLVSDDKTIVVAQAKQANFDIKPKESYKILIDIFIAIVYCVPLLFLVIISTLF